MMQQLAWRLKAARTAMFVCSLIILSTFNPAYAGCAVVNPTSNDAQIFGGLFVASHYCSVFKNPMTGDQFYGLMMAHKVFGETQGDDLAACGSFAASIKDKYLDAFRQEGKEKMCTSIETFISRNPGVGKWMRMLRLCSATM